MVGDPYEPVVDLFHIVLCAIIIGLFVFILFPPPPPDEPYNPLADCAWTLTPLDNGTRKLEGICK